MASTMDGKVNYLGAAIFWSYIVAALVLTAMVLHTLVKIRPKRSSSNNAKRGVLIFSTFAICSFAALSVNMLNVLIRSFNSWAGHKQPAVASDFISSIWNWSLTSYLFQYFAEALVENNARYLWSQAGLLTTFIVCLFISVEGPRAGVPRLWAFFGLSQILPVSFTQNLFYVALLRASDGPIQGGISDGMYRRLRLLTVAYCCALIIIPIAYYGAWLMPLVFATRVLLFAPFLLPGNSNIGGSRTKPNSDAEPNTSGLSRLILVPAMGTMLFQFYTVSEEKQALSKIGSAVFEHPAVSALGYDFIMSMVSGAVWLGLQSRQKEKSS